MGTDRPDDTEEVRGEVTLIIHLGDDQFVVQADDALVMIGRETLVKILKRRGGDGLGTVTVGRD